MRAREVAALLFGRNGSAWYFVLNEVEGETIYLTAKTRVCINAEAGSTSSTVRAQ